MASSSDNLIDHSTNWGKLKLFCFRWQSIIGGLLLLAGVAAVLAFVWQSDLIDTLGSGQQQTPGNYTLQGSRLSFIGEELKFNDRSFEQLPDFPEHFDPKDVTELEVKWVKIRGDKFSQALANFTNLVTLSLNNVTIIEHLQPAYLPKLKSFTLIQGLDITQLDLDEYLIYEPEHFPNEYVNSILFFLPPSKENFYTRLATIPIDYISVYFRGSVLFQIDKMNEEIRLDIPMCQQFLKDINFKYSRITLSNCRDVDGTYLSPQVTYLNVYLLLNTTAEKLSSIIRKPKGLKMAFIEIPEIELSMSDFSPDIETLSISSMILYIPEGFKLPKVKNFYFGGLNQYGWVKNRTTALDSTIIDVLPSVEKVGLFELPGEDRYQLLQQILRKPTVRWVLCVGFSRRKDDFIQLPVDNDDFLLQRNDSSSDYSVSSVTLDEKLEHRYYLLGWDTVDTYNKYLYVQNIISNGGILGDES